MNLFLMIMGVIAIIVAILGGIGFYLMVLFANAMKD